MSGLIASHRVHKGKKSVILDPVNPTDFLNLKFTFACEQCVHYDLPNKNCTLGHNSKLHNESAQLHFYNLCGRMAFCRFLEID